MARKKQQGLVLVEQIGPLILTIRDQKVLLDSDLATLYGVPTKAFNQAVKRNRGRFPPDFMFQLTAEEAGIDAVTVCDRIGRANRHWDANGDPHPNGMCATARTPLPSTERLWRRRS